MTTRLKLTTEQLNSIRELEYDSFLQFCHKIQRAPAEYAAFCLDLIKQEAQAILDFNRDTYRGPGAEKIKSFYQGLAASTDMWETDHLVVDANKTDNVDTIVAAAPSLPINFDYLSRLAVDLGLTPPKLDAPDTLRDFLIEIPIVSFWSTEFNAFLQGRSVIGSVPCVVFYHHINTMTTGFLELFAPALMRFRSHSLCELLPVSETSRIASEKGFMKACRDVLGVAFSTSGEAFFEPQYAFRHIYPERLAEFYLLTKGAQDFVWYHEYGHLLMGHLLVGPCRQVEIQADAFATLVLGESAQTSEALLWKATGAAVLLVLLCIIEHKQTGTPSSSHPAAQERLKQFLSVIREPLHSTLVDVVRGIEAACNPTLREWWRTSLTCDTGHP